jgi:hypothetical protein
VVHVTGGVERAFSLGSELLAAAQRGIAAQPATAPAGLVMRRLDAAGEPQPSRATHGPEEFFVPGSLPREERLPPE